MITLEELYEDFNEALKDIKAFDLFLNEAASDYFYRRQPIDIPAMVANGRIVDQYEPADEQAFDDEIDAKYVCQYEFTFGTRTAIVNRTLVLPADSTGDRCSIVLIRKDGQSGRRNNFAMMKLMSNGKFVKGWKFDAVLDQILTVWVYGTQYNENTEMSPDFLVKTFGGRNTQRADNRITITVNEQLYSNHAIIDLITNDMRYKHLHTDHPERCEKIGKIIRSQNGFIGNPVIVAEPHQRRDYDRYGNRDTHPIVITDRNFIIIYERNTTISDQNLFDIYKCSASTLITKFWRLNHTITRSYRSKYGTGISKALVKQAIADEEAGLIND